MNLLDKKIRVLDARALERTGVFKLVQRVEMGGNFLTPGGQDMDHLASVKQFSNHASRAGSGFYDEPEGREFFLSNNELRFASYTPEELLANREAHATVYRARNRKRAIVFLHHWNAKVGDYHRFAKTMSLFGVTTVLLTLPFHGIRGSGGRIAHELLSANIGRTIAGMRQSVGDCRGALTWLVQEGYKSVGIGGVSLGSAIATLVAAHDSRVKALGLLLPVYDLPYVVWAGSATAHIRAGVEQALTLNDLQECWKVISPKTYYPYMRAVPTLSIAGRLDEVAPHTQVETLVNELRNRRVRSVHRLMRAGHHTFTLPWISAATISRAVTFFRKHL